MSHPQSNNRILQRLSADDFQAVKPFLERVELTLKQELIKPNVPISHVFFLENGVGSIIAQTEGSERIEVGLIGREGMTNHVTEQGDVSVLQSIAQVPGQALAVEAERYVDWIFNRPGVLRLILRYQEAMRVQLAYTALAHGSFTVEERLARWLLMSFDRTDGADMPMVHEFLAMMLAVRRSGVTTATHILEGRGAIRATRGRIQLRDREILEEMTAGSYGIPEREYARLMGPAPAR
jgi:CRP-like cAMP-binding protein